MNAADQALVKDAERMWFDAYYRERARKEYPETLAEFAKDSNA
jgi:hypothetical protein